MLVVVLLKLDLHLAILVELDDLIQKLGILLEL